MTRLYVDLVKDSLTEFSYDASLAGLQYDLGSTILGLSMTLSGYNDKLHVLAQHVLEKARNLDVREDRLAVIKENVGYLSELYDQRGLKSYCYFPGQVTMAKRLPRADLLAFGILSEICFGGQPIYPDGETC